MEEARITDGDRIEKIHAAIHNHDKLTAILNYYLLTEKPLQLQTKIQFAFWIPAHLQRSPSFATTHSGVPAVNWMLMYIDREKYTSMQDFKFIYKDNDQFIPSLVSLIMQQQYLPLQIKFEYKNTTEYNAFGFKAHAVHVFYDKAIDKTYVFCAFDTKYMYGCLYDSKLDVKKLTAVCAHLGVYVGAFL